MLIGLVLVVVGVFALLVKEGVLAISTLSYIWPAFLILVGLLMVWGVTYGRRHWTRYNCCCAPQNEQKLEQK